MSRNNGHQKRTNSCLRFGIVGAGAIADTYGRACSACDNVQVVAIADTRAEAASALAEKLGCRAFNSCETMASKVRLDAAIVCTPPSSHCDVSLCLLDRGIHVLCEKPLSLDLRSATEMAKAAQKNNVKLTMGSKFRYVDDVVRAKRIVMSGILGDIILFENAFTSRSDMSSRWNSEPHVSGGGVLIDNGSHSVDLVRYFLGPLAELQVMEGIRVQGLDVEETVHLFVRSLSGVMGSIDLSWSIHKEQPNYISIYGSKGTVFVGWKKSKYRQSASESWVEFGQGYNKLQAFQSQVRNFARSILGQEMLVIDAQDAIASVEAVATAYTALRQNQWIRVGRAQKAVHNYHYDTRYDVMRNAVVS